MNEKSYINEKKHQILAQNHESAQPANDLNN